MPTSLLWSSRNIWLMWLFLANSFATAIFLAKGAFNNYVDKKGLSWAQISQERKKLSKKIALAKYLIFEVGI